MTSWMNTLASLVKTNSLKIHILQQYLLYKINLLSSFKTNLHPAHTQNTCWFQFFLLMKMLIFLKPPIKKLHCHCTKGLDFIGLWLYLVVWYFYRQKLQCHCTKCPVFLVIKMHSTFNPPHVLHCNMHGLPTYYKQTTCSFYYKMTISYRTEKVYTKKELVLLETSIPEFQESFHISEIKTGISFDTCAYPQKPPLWRRTPRGI